MAKLERRYLWAGRRHQLGAQIEGDRLYLEMDGHPVEFNIVPGANGAFVLRQGDRVLAGYAVATPDAVWVQLDGRTWVLEAERPTRARGAGPAPSSGDVASPMTGTVRKVFIEEGQEVVERAPLLVVEAMKMEFTITAPMAGRVARLLCEAGQSVELGQMLVQVVGADEAAPIEGPPASGSPSTPR